MHGRSRSRRQNQSEPFKTVQVGATQQEAGEVTEQVQEEAMGVTMGATGALPTVVPTTDQVATEEEEVTE